VRFQNYDLSLQSGGGPSVVWTAAVGQALFERRENKNASLEECIGSPQSLAERRTSGRLRGL
jgi:hypothetical protein